MNGEIGAFKIQIPVFEIPIVQESGAVIDCDQYILAILVVDKMTSPKTIQLIS